MPQPDFNSQPPEISRHGYWGPLPWESPELYKALGTPMMEKVTLGKVPGSFRGEFNMQAGRDIIEAGVRQKVISPPAELTRQERLGKFIDFTKSNEIAHLKSLAVLGAIGTATLLEGGWLGAGTATLLGTLNIIANVPPILVQRYNRLRAYRLLDRINDRPNQ